MSTYSTYSDEQLFRLVAAGDQLAYKQLFHRFIPQLTPFVFKLIKTDLAVDDILQDVFYKIWLNRSQLAEIGNPRSYLIKMALNASFEYLRQQKINRKVISLFTNSLALQDSETPESISSYNATVRLIAEAADKLPPQAKLIYTLSNEQGLKPAEIASKLNLSIQTVRNTLSRAMTGIRTQLNQQDISFPIIFFLLFF